jgi:2-amino-4-hydroxy-6-hydroxymethyldihydropteridine diphosphokinase
VTGAHVDTIFLRALTTDAIIGIYDWERRVRQTVVIDLEIPCDVRKAAAADHIEATLNYKKVAKRVLAFVEASNYHLVETLAEHVALMLLHEFGLAWVKLTLNKPGAIRGARDVGVTIHRTSEDLKNATGRALSEPQRRIRVHVAAGSNVEPERNLVKALAALERRFGPLRVSSAYRNPAVGFEGADFINLVVGFDTIESLPAVVEALQAIEEECGRPRGAPKWGPRSMDLDLLLYGDEVRDEPGLRLPRADLLTRAYVLGPLAEIAGHLTHPENGRRFAELWNAFDRSAHPMEKVTLPGR